MSAICRTTTGLTYYHKGYTVTASASASASEPTDWMKWEELKVIKERVYGREQFILADTDDNSGSCFSSNTRTISVPSIKGPKLASVYKQEETSQQSLF
jgi:hypothetical protein